VRPGVGSATTRPVLSAVFGVEIAGERWLLEPTGSTPISSETKQVSVTFISWDYELACWLKIPLRKWVVFCC
jgi:hypothetical protein